MHRRRQIGANYIDESGRCPVCNRTYHTRLRAIKHVSSVTSCRDGLASGDFEKIIEAHSTKLDNADRAETRRQEIWHQCIQITWLASNMITRANLFDTSSTCFFTMRFFFWIFSSTLIEDQSPTDWKKRLQVRHSDLSQTLVVLDSGRGDGSWHSGYADWKNISSRPNQKRLWMCTTCVHYNSSKAACSQCGLRRSWAEVVKGVANELCHSSVTAQGRNQGVGSSACCTTRQCRPLWKSTSPSGREASTRSQRGARQQTLVPHVRPFFGNQPTCTNSPFHDEVVFSHAVLYSCDSSER